MSRVVIALTALALTTAIALAQQPASPSADQYWQQIIASKEAQSSQQIVSLAQQLDAAKAEITKLQKQLSETNAKTTTPPASGPK